MKKKLKQKHAISKEQFIKLLKKHKTLKVVAVDATNGKVSRERIIAASGKSIVRYPTYQYKTKLNAHGQTEYVKDSRGYYVIQSVKWSRYRDSCYKQNISEKQKEFKQTLDLIVSQIDNSSIVKKSVAVIKRHMKKDMATLITKAMYDHDGQYIVIKEIYSGRNYKRKLV